MDRIIRLHVRNSLEIRPLNSDDIPKPYDVTLSTMDVNIDKIVHELNIILKRFCLKYGYRPLYFLPDCVKFCAMKSFFKSDQYRDIQMLPVHEGVVVNNPSEYLQYYDPHHYR